VTPTEKKKKKRKKGGGDGGARGCVGGTGRSMGTGKLRRLRRERGEAEGAVQFSKRGPISIGQHYGWLEIKFGEAWGEHDSSSGRRGGTCQ